MSLRDECDALGVLIAMLVRSYSFHPGWLDPYATYKEYTVAAADLCAKVSSPLYIVS